jgi:F0F1-type ATP synthase delta subunit
MDRKAFLITQKEKQQVLDWFEKLKSLGQTNEKDEELANIFKDPKATLDFEKN